MQGSMRLLVICEVTSVQLRAGFLDRSKTDPLYARCWHSASLALQSMA